MLFIYKATLPTLLKMLRKFELNVGTFSLKQYLTLTLLVNNGSAIVDASTYFALI